MYLLLYICSSYHLSSELQETSDLYNYLYFPMRDCNKPFLIGLLSLQLWNWIGCCFFTSSLFSSLTDSSASKDCSTGSHVHSNNGLTYTIIMHLSKESLIFESELVCESLLFSSLCSRVLIGISETSSEEAVPARTLLKGTWWTGNHTRGPDQYWLQMNCDLVLENCPQMEMLY